MPPPGSDPKSNGNIDRRQYGEAPISPVEASPVHNNPNNIVDDRGVEQTDPTYGKPARRTTTFETKRSIFDQAQVRDLDGAASRLGDDSTPLSPVDFYELMGMTGPVKGVYPKDFAIPNGLFAKIKEAYDGISFRYHMFNVLVYFLMTLQLLLSAIFIVLGSLTNVDSHVAVAVLGAIGTVVAGVLALMKGQGLPNRLRQGRDSLGMVLFEAQELWWDVRARRPILYKDIRKVREDYLRVMDDQRRNHPDNWNPTTNKIVTEPPAGKKAGWASRLTLPR